MAMQHLILTCRHCKNKVKDEHPNWRGMSNWPPVGHHRLVSGYSDAAACWRKVAIWSAVTA